MVGDGSIGQQGGGAVVSSTPLVRRYVQTQVDEIAADGVLRIYGAVLACSHLLTLWWWVHADAVFLLSRGKDHLCWPMLEGCVDWSYPSPGVMSVVLTGYALFAVAGAGLFLLRRETVGLAWGALVLLTLLKLAVMALDFRTRLNQHYMMFFVTVPFLFLPKKRVAVRLMLPFFYFWAGTLKLNREWLSGAALYGDIWGFDRQSLPYACAYVVVLELVMVWGLWARSGWIFWATVFQLGLFHLLSFNVVGLFYPLLMAGLLSIFPLSRLLQREAGLGPFSKAWVPGLAAVGVFSALQLMPYAFPGDTTLTGEGRLFALHMFDAKLECTSFARVRRRGADDETVKLESALPPRIQCDPVVYLSLGNNLCKRLKTDSRFEDMDVTLSTKRTTDLYPVPVMDVRDFCRKQLRYSLLRSNDWINASAGRGR